MALARRRELVVSTSMGTTGGPLELLGPGCAVVSGRVVRLVVGRRRSVRRPRQSSIHGTVDWDPNSSPAALRSYVVAFAKEDECTVK